MESIRNVFINIKLTLYGYYEKYISNMSTERTLILIGYGLVGVISGFICKNYGRYIFGLLLCILISTFVFSHFNFVTINYDVLKATLGVSPAANFQDAFYIYMNIIKTNIFTAILVMIGFFIGWKLG